MHLRATIVLLSFLSSLSGCASHSAAGVPTLDANALHRPSFVGLTPRTIAVEVVDARSPLPTTSAQMVAEVTRALEARFQSAGLRVEPGHTANKLVVTVMYKEQPIAGYEREDCVWFRGHLTSSAGAWTEAEGGACFEWRHALGFHLGGDASRAYETGLSSVIEVLDHGFATLSARTMERDGRRK